MYALSGVTKTEQNWDWTVNADLVQKTTAVGVKRREPSWWAAGVQRRVDAVGPRRPRPALGEKKPWTHTVRAEVNRILIYVSRNVHRVESSSVDNWTYLLQGCCIGFFCYFDKWFPILCEDYLRGPKRILKIRWLTRHQNLLKMYHLVKGSLFGWHRSQLHIAWLWRTSSQKNWQPTFINCSSVL